MLKTLTFKFFNRFIDWLFYRRGPAGLLVKSGVALLIAALGLSFAGKLFYRDSDRALSIEASTSDGLPGWAVIICFWLGLFLAVVGVGIAIHRSWFDMRREARRKVIIVEMRGLQSSPDTPAKEADLGDMAGQREWLLLDFRTRTASGTVVSPDSALAKLAAMLHTIETMSAGRDKSDISLAIGGLAPVPLLFLAGMLIDDETDVTIFDWDRNVKAWRLTEGADDGKRFIPPDLSLVYGGDNEVVLAVAVSYPIDNEALTKTFGLGIPIVRLTAEEVIADRHWSTEKQSAFVVALRDAVQALMARGVKRIHMVLAAPASQTIRMGMAYDRRLMPELIVYQYEKSATPPYPWGVLMPTHGITSASVVASANPATIPI